MPEVNRALLSHERNPTDMRTPRFVLVVSIVISAGLGWRPVAHAQYTSAGSGATWNNPMSASIDTMISNRLMSRGMSGQVKRGLSGTTGSSPRRRGTTTFTPGRRALLDRVPAPERSQVSQLLPACDKIYAEVLSRTAGIRAPAELNDLATSTAFVVATAHYLFWVGKPDSPPRATPAHLQRLRTVLRDIYDARGTFAGMSDVEKQATQDGLLVSFCIPFLQFDQAQKAGNEAAEQSARAQAASLLARFGFSPSTLHFLPDGTVSVDAR